MNNKRIKVTLYNRTYKEIDMSDFTCLPEELFANRDDIVENFHRHLKELKVKHFLPALILRVHSMAKM